ncbi:MAG: hypothetical protein ACTSYA_01700 [Candidatus Kariarchaeaceae archaeon]
MSEKVEIDSSQVTRGSYHFPRKNSIKFKVLKYISERKEGCTAQEVSKNLGISINTVRPYCQSLFVNNLISRGAKYGFYYGIDEVEILLLGVSQTSQLDFDKDLYKLLLAYENVHNLAISLPVHTGPLSYDFSSFSFETIDWLNTGRSLLIVKSKDPHGLPFDQISKVLGALEFFCQVHDIDYYDTYISRREINVDHPGSMTEPRFISIETFAKTAYVTYPKIINGRNYVRSEHRAFFKERVYPTHKLEAHLHYARNPENAHHILKAYLEESHNQGKETRRLQTAIGQTKTELINAKNDLVDIGSGIKSNLNFAYDNSKEVEMNLKEIGSRLDTMSEQTSTYQEGGLFSETSQLVETKLKEIGSSLQTFEDAYQQSVENEGLLVSNLQKLSQVRKKDLNLLKEIGSEVVEVNHKIDTLEINQETFRESLNDQSQKLVLIDEKIDQLNPRVRLQTLLKSKFWTIDELTTELDHPRSTVNYWIQEMRKKGLLQEKKIKQKRGAPKINYKLGE